MTIFFGARGGPSHELSKEHDGRKETARTEGDKRAEEHPTTAVREQAIRDVDGANIQREKTERHYAETATDERRYVELGLNCPIEGKDAQ